MAIEDILEKIRDGKEINREEFIEITKETDWNEFTNKTLDYIRKRSDEHDRARRNSYAKGFFRYIR